MGSNINTSYRGIFKATSLFGGLQLYQIIIGIIRSKLIAILLGTEGMGISGLYQSGLDLIKECTSLGLSRSAVRDVAEANGTEDFNRISRTVTVLKKLVWFTGIFGMLAVILLSPILSHTSFGNYDFIIPFIALSVILLFNQISSGQTALLQGLRKYKYLAKATAIGNTLGLVFTIPLYYLFGTNGIVPALIINAVITLFLNYYYTNKVRVNSVSITAIEVISEGKGMMSLGVIMSINGMLVLGCAYAIRAYISHEGGLDEVGLYNAGFAIVNTYVGMIFSAMTADYFPRLSAVNKDNEKCKELVNQQAEIAVLLLSPIVLACITFTPLALYILYSDKFLPVSGFVMWALFGMIIKAVAWSLSYMFVAKGENLLFIKNEIVANLSNLVLCVVGYKLGGLSGLGIGYMLHFFVYILLLYFVASRKYNYRYSKSLIQILLFQLSLAMFSIIINLTLRLLYLYSISIILIIASVLFSYHELDKRMDITKYIKNKK